MSTYGNGSAAPAVTLVPFTVDWLAAVQPWFSDPEVRRRLGGPQWPERELTGLETEPGEIFRGRRVLRVHSWVVLDAQGRAAAKIGGDIYDRTCRYREGPDGPVVAGVEPGPAMGLAYVVDPQRRRSGFGRAALTAVVNAPEVDDVVVFTAGIEPDNVASIRCAASAGFAPDDPEPDWEGIVYYVLRRPRPAVR